MKDSENLYINTEIFDKMLSGVNKCSRILDRYVERSNKDYNGLKDSDLYKKGFNKLEDGVSTTSHTLFNVNKVHEEFLSRFIELEEKGVELVDSLYIPDDFKTNNDFYISNFSRIGVNKSDGKYVKTYVTDEAQVDEEHDIIKEEIKNDNKDVDSTVEIEKIDEIDKKMIDSLQRVIDKDKKRDISDIEISESNISKQDDNGNQDDIIINEINEDKAYISDIEKETVPQITDDSNYEVNIEKEALKKNENTKEFDTEVDTDVSQEELSINEESKVEDE